MGALAAWLGLRERPAVVSGFGPMKGAEPGTGTATIYEDNTTLARLTYDPTTRLFQTTYDVDGTSPLFRHYPPAANFDGLYFRR